MKNLSRQLTGFTLIELLIVIAIIAGLAVLSLPLLNGVSSDAEVVTAMSEMDTIKEAVRERFYADLGFIPEDPGDPDYATRYLCLQNDGDVGVSWDGTDFMYAPDPGAEESLEMAVFLSEQLFAQMGDGNLAAERAEQLLGWDPYSRRGWRGPYLEREAVVVADDRGTAACADDELYPVVIDPWQRVLEAGDADCICCDERTEVLGGYRVFGGQDKDLSQIASYGRHDRDGDGNIADSDTVTGTDGNTYVAIRPHISSAVDNQPITGANWIDFWSLDNTQTSPSTWAAGIDYKSFSGDDIAMFAFGGGATQSPLNN